jgi:hypothetical protein
VRASSDGGERSRPAEEVREASPHGLEATRLPPTNRCATDAGSFAPEGAAMVGAPRFLIGVPGDAVDAERADERFAGGTRQGGRQLARGGVRARGPDLDLRRRTASTTAVATSSGPTTGSARGRAWPSIMAVSTWAGCTTVKATPEGADPVDAGVVDHDHQRAVALLGLVEECLEPSVVSHVDVER